MVQIKDKSYQELVVLVEDLAEDSPVWVLTAERSIDLDALLGDLKAAKGGYGHGTRQA